MRILVPLDGSPFAETVISTVAQIAEQSKADVFLVQVVDPSGVHGTSTEVEWFPDMARAEFEEATMRIREVADDLGGPTELESPGQALDRVSQEAKDYLSDQAGRFESIQPESVVLLGRDVDEELLKFVTEQHIDLIAMSTHGRTGLARLVLGSHAEHIMRSGVAPVLLVRPDNLNQ